MQPQYYIIGDAFIVRRDGDKMVIVAPDGSETPYNDIWEVSVEGRRISVDEALRFLAKA